MSFAALVFRWALADVFVVAGLAKLRQPGRFSEAVRGYGFLPEVLVGPVATALPVTELALGAALAVGLGTPSAALLLAALVVGFSVAVSVNLLRGRSIDCGCSGLTGSQSITWGVVARNFALIMIAIFVASSAPDVLSIGGGGSRSAVSNSDAVAALLVGVVATTCTQLLIEIRNFARGSRRLLEKAAA